MTSEIGDIIKQWTALKENISSARKALKLMTDQEKDLKSQVQEKMARESWDVINVGEGSKISLTKRESKGSLTLVVLKNALMEFYDGDENTVERVLNVVNDHRKVKKTQSLSYRKPFIKKRGP